MERAHPRGCSPGLTAGVWRVAAGPRHVYLVSVCLKSALSVSDIQRVTSTTHFGFFFQLKPRYQLRLCASATKSRD